MTYKCEEHILG